VNIYKAYNLCIASELPLPELVEIEGHPDVTVRLTRLNQDDASHNGGNCCRAKFEGVGEFLILNGCEIRVDPAPEVEASLLRITLLGPVFCVLLRQRGFLVLHASCVDIERQGVAFVGGSGWGKSTLAAAFQAKGHRVLTDDVMPIDLQTQAIALPSYPQGKLWPEAATSLGHNPEELAPISSASPKLVCQFSDRFQSTPLPLQRIYVLDKGTTHSITPLQPQEAFVELIRHTRVIHFMNDASAITTHFRLCTELINRVSFCRFTRKPDLTDLPTLVQLVETDLAQANCSTELQKVALS
jgi:hypothetical protein